MLCENYVTSKMPKKPTESDFPSLRISNAIIKGKPHTKLCYNNFAAYIRMYSFGTKLEAWDINFPESYISSLQGLCNFFYIRKINILDNCGNCNSIYYLIMKF